MVGEHAEFSRIKSIDIVVLVLRVDRRISFAQGGPVFKSLSKT